ncbi:type IX secretion/gliding motility protein PorT/SprT [Chitinophaga lutea]
MLRLFRFPVTGLLLLLLTSLTANAQMNMEEHDRKPYYFGITLAANQSYFRLTHSDIFLQQDSIMVAEPLKTVGFNLGLLANLRLSNRFDIRANPQLLFANKNLFYAENYPKRNTEKKVESIVVSFPLQLKFKSDRINNMRVYTIAGLKVDHDLASNKNTRQAEDLLKINKTTYGFELGAGFEFYFPSFIFTPEFKISNGLNDVHIKDKNLRYSNVIDQLHSRMIVFSIHLQG